MKALSIRQPWANFIFEGSKIKEIRSWATNYRGDLLICASKAPAEFLKKCSEVDDLGRYRVIDKEFHDSDYMYFGKAFFVVELFDCRKMVKEDEEFSLVAFDPQLFAWSLRNIRPVKPFEVKGKLSLFEVNDPLIFL